MMLALDLGREGRELRIESQQGRARRMLDVHVELRRAGLLAERDLVHVGFVSSLECFEVVVENGEGFDENELAVGKSVIQPRRSVADADIEHGLRSESAAPRVLQA